MNSKFLNIQEVGLVYKSKFKHSDRPKVTSSTMVYKMVLPFFESEIDFIENFYIVLLNRANSVIGVSHISKGGMSGTIADGKVMFATGLKANAHAMILVHNHPSGQLKPSEADRQLTKKMVEFGKYIDMPILDHLIITSEGYFSFADNGLIS